MRIRQNSHKLRARMYDRIQTIYSFPKFYENLPTFEVSAESVLKLYADRGLTDIKKVILTKEERDAKPLSCDTKTTDGRFIGGSYDGMTDSAGMPTWFELP